MGFLVDKVSSTIAPGSLMILYLSDEMDMDLRIPEIYGLLGEKMTMAFLEIFGGRTINVPPVKKVREAFKAVSAHTRFGELSKVNSESDAAAQVGVELDMTPQQVMVAWAKVRSMLTRLEESVQHVAEES